MITREQLKINREERKQRLSLTLLFSAVVILIFISILLLVFAGLYLLVRTGILKNIENSGITAGQLLLIFVGASIVVGSCLTLLLSRYPMKPINNLLNIMNRLASGDFTARIKLPKPWNRHPGMVELADSFNTMAQELQNTEILRSDFINNFSHEFKTPIVSITGFAKLLKHEELTPQQKEYVEIIEEESLRLSRMATNVLHLSKVENQAILTDVTTFNLSEQLRSCILLLSSSWEKKNMEFSLEFREHRISGNKELLDHVWINLIDNAIKFSPENGFIEITIGDYLNFIEVSVINRGPEISSEEKERIFDKFYQADTSHATEGNGVGLAIVKKVVALHGGSISVQSENGLTMFSVRLPK